MPLINQLKAPLTQAKRANKIANLKSCVRADFAALGALSELATASVAENFASCEVWERPVPGMPRVLLTPFLPTFMVAPLPPIEALTPLLLRLRCNPGAILILFLNLNPMMHPQSAEQ
ncbi:hypothetical protein [Pantoea septica]|uniref:hypothetical protein n=1 Tax=Pantoea septica TaxID=472695 RepID=UPI003D0535B9